MKFVVLTLFLVLVCSYQARAAPFWTNSIPNPFQLLHGVVNGLVPKQPSPPKNPTNEPNVGSRRPLINDRVWPLGQEPEVLDAKRYEPNVGSRRPLINDRVWPLGQEPEVLG
ncbi:hypothetical protein TKK_0008585 [Trichogramma kaykai]